MARPLWKGYLSFGLVTIPCALSSMEEPEKEINFSMLDKRDKARIRYLRVNEKTGKEVPWGEIVKGHEVREGDWVVVSPEDLKKAAPKATKTLDIVGFVEAKEIAPWYYERPYAVVPLEGGEKGCGLLQAALDESSLVGIARLVLHTREHLAALFSFGKVLVLNTLRYASEVRDPVELVGPAGKGAAAKPSKGELDMALTLIKTMKVDWKPEQYHDQYRDTLRKWIAAQAKGGKAKPIEAEEEEIPETYNMMDMLRKSIAGQKTPAKGHRQRRKAG